MTVRQIKTWFCSLFYVPRYEKMTDQSLSRILLSSVMGIVLCGICLAGLTWAWFSDSVASQSSAITAADYSAQIEVVQTESGVELQPTKSGNYTLDAGTGSDTYYTVTVTADGSASTGYCTVKLILADNDIRTYHTIQLFPAGGDGKPKSVDFTVNVSNSSYLTITPQWGTYANTTEPRIGKGTGDLQTIPPDSVNASQELTLTAVSPETFTLTEEEQSYTVQSGDTLYDIAGLYGTTVDTLAAYNDIQDPDTIYAGAVIKIPPAGYTVSENIASGESNESEPENTVSETEPAGTDISSSSSDTSDDTTEKPSP